MEGQNQKRANGKGGIHYLMNTKNWWQPLLFILIISLLGVGMIGFQTYNDAPPMSGFTTSRGEVVIDQARIERGQEVFHKYALMEYGAMFGDGAQRGPDFTAEALHEITLSMNRYYVGKFEEENQRPPTDREVRVLESYTQEELKKNLFDEEKNTVLLTDAQWTALRELEGFYIAKFTSTGKGAFPVLNYISDEQELRDLSAFFFWGAWVCVAERPGSDFSYTHNWPYDPYAGNTATSPVILWSVLG
ncbi:MAG: nitric-oxide reductase, partial [Cyclobacteriaceae bacterium]|nr:nitric-oxide reductase [Cyclobacteriaceae bacterium]